MSKPKVHLQSVPFHCPLLPRTNQILEAKLESTLSFLCGSISPSRFCISAYELHPKVPSLNNKTSHSWPWGQAIWE